jgi:hypothetical protein
MVDDRPVFVDEGKEPIHKIGDFPEMRRLMTPYVDRLFAIAAAELSDVRDGDIVQHPKGVLIKGLDSLFKTNIDAVGQEIILSQKILFLNSGK